VAAITGCSSTPEPKSSDLAFSSSPIGVLEMVPTYFSKFPEEAPPSWVELPIWLKIDAISGDFYGETLEKPRTYGPFEFGAGMALDYDEIVSYLTTYAQPASATASKLIVTPAETRIARLATFLQRDDQVFVRSTLFSTIPVRTDHSTMVLVYVDRPCHIRGRLHRLADNDHQRWDEIDVTFLAPGLHWLVIEMSDPEHHRVIRPGKTDYVYLLGAMN
jgi:hypothetical protein